MSLIEIVVANPGKAALAAVWVYTAHVSALPTPEEAAELSAKRWAYLYLYRLQTILANRLPKQGSPVQIAKPL